MLWTRPVWLALMLTLLAACVPPVEEDDDTVPEFTTDTVMGVIQEKGVLEVGIEPDRPPMSTLDEDGRAEGFVAELAREVAASLGVEVEFFGGSTEELLAAPNGGRADITFPLVAATEELVRDYAFTEPYYVAHQRLLVPQGSGIESVADLSGRVCSVLDPVAGIPLDELNDSIRPVTAPEPADCVRLFEEGEAATGPDFVLLSMQASGFSGEIVGDQLTTFGMGAVVIAGAGNYRTFVNNVFNEFEVESRWTAAWEEHIDLPGETPEPPDLTLGEAASLWPRGKSQQVR